MYVGPAAHALVVAEGYVSRACIRPMAMVRRVSVQIDADLPHVAAHDGAGLAARAHAQVVRLIVCIVAARRHGLPIKVLAWG